MNMIKQWLAVLATVFAITATSVSAQAAKATPSPFAGEYCFGLCHVTVSASGSITGTCAAFDGFPPKISGHISADGAIKLTISTNRHGKGNNPTRETATGIAALDENGNLYGVLEWSDGQLGEFFWYRCE
jgi:hypothetical protein